MDEHVFAAVRLGNETKALRLVEPLHGATSQLKLLVTGFENPTVAANSRCGCARSIDRHFDRSGSLRKIPPEKSLAGFERSNTSTHDRRRAQDRRFTRTWTVN